MRRADLGVGAPPAAPVPLAARLILTLSAGGLCSSSVDGSEIRTGKDNDSTVCGDVLSRLLLLLLDDDEATSSKERRDTGVGDDTHAAADVAFSSGDDDDIDCSELMRASDGVVKRARFAEGDKMPTGVPSSRLRGRYVSGVS